MAKRWTDVDWQYTEPNKEYYIQELEKINASLEDFCAISRIDKKIVKVNIKTIREVVKRVDMRQLYFQVFHKGMEINEYKLIVGLTVFWIIKLKPFWLDIDNDTTDDAMLELAAEFNERFALHMVSMLLNEYNPSFVEKGEDLFQAYCDELIYSFRYRDLSKESLFLMFDPFYYLYFLNNSVNTNGDLTL